MSKNKIAEEKTKKFKNFVEASNIEGVEFIDIDDVNKALRSFFNVEGQEIPFFVVINDSIYSYIRVYIANGVKDSQKKEKILAYLNGINENYSMLKYYLNTEGQVILECSVPASDNHFEPALLIALIDQILGHLEQTYKDIMKQIWE